MCSCHGGNQRAQIGPASSLTLYLASRSPQTAAAVTRSALTRRSPASQDPGTPSAANMENVAIFDSPGKGRGLKATKEFWAGDVIFSEPSLAAVVFDRYGNDVIHGSECFDDKICAAILHNSLLSSSNYVVFILKPFRSSFKDFL